MPLEIITANGKEAWIVTASEEVQQVIADVQAALAQSQGTLGYLGLRVDEITIDLKTVLTKSAGGEIDLKVVKIGGSGSTQRSNTVSIVMEPIDVVSATPIHDELSAALAVVEGALASVQENFAIVETTAEISFATQVNGKIKVILGGDISHEVTHVARIKFVPSA